MRTFFCRFSFVSEESLTLRFRTMAVREASFATGIDVLDG